ncbi:hypothetical protein ACFQVC_24280 [Streptomyces monticola]|uniref:Lipoprotein n=1 Tax=Streptomyces monticola TaxID=2666263 RepID=A0ABW2JPQ0_9ACTN
MGGVRVVRPKWVRAAGVCAVVGLLASCGGGGGGGFGAFPVERGAEKAVGKGGSQRAASQGAGSAARLVEESFGLLAETTSVRMTAVLEAPDGEQRTTLHLDREGNCTGSVDAGPMKRGDVIVLADGRMWLRYSERALAEVRAEAERRGPEIAARVRERTAMASGKYLRLPRTAAFSDGMCDLDKAQSTLPGARPVRSGEVRRRPAVTRDGQRVVPVTGPRGAAGEETLYVAASGKPSLVAITGEQQGRSLEIGFSGYGTKVLAGPPPREQELVLRGGGGLLEV